MPSAPSENYYFISGCEPSGDLLARDLVVALKEIWPEMRACGIAGPAMREAGVIPLAAMEDLTVMGFVEVLKHLKNIKQIETNVLERAVRLNPRCAILVDYPGFHFKLAERLKGRGIPVCQYVAPQLWAWGEKRTATLRQVTDLVLGIMPFETDFFRHRGVNFQYVGTPQVDRTSGLTKDRALFGLQEGPLIGFFPGSRLGEVKRIAPAIVSIRRELRKLAPELRFAVSVAPSVSPEAFHELFGDEGSADRITAELVAGGTANDSRERTTFVRGNSLKLMKACDAALVTSGTATLECGLAGTPMAVIYVTSPLTYRIAKRAVKLPYISLVNLVAGEQLVREFVQHIDAPAAAAELLALASPGPKRQKMEEALNGLRLRVKGEPARHAARALNEWISPKRPCAFSPG